MANVGHAVLLTAFIVALCSAAASIAAAFIKNPSLVAVARNGIFAVCLLYSVAIAVMIYATITNDFDIALVARHSSKDLSLTYKITALYSDKAGSLMFWGWLMSTFAVILILQKRSEFRRATQYAAGVLAIVLAFFLLLVNVVINVFARSPFPVENGLGLNPQLQNPGMAIHPPLLFCGYAGFTIVFAFSIGELILNCKDKDWINGIRRWAILSWATLGLANLVGAWWARDVGNWGGYWVWDPVENAGLMPWLLGTALIHSMAMQRKRGYLKSWVILLIILVFALTLLSPFISHGGLQKSPLHGFANSPVPPYMLSFIAIVLAGSFGLVLVRRKCLQDSGRPQSIISEGGAFLFMNLLLGLIVLFILMGTIIPGIAEHLGNSDVSIKRSFFDWTAGPLLLLLVLLMGVCPLLARGRATPEDLLRNAKYSLLISFIVALALLLSGIGNWYALAAVVCGFPLCTIVQEWCKAIQSGHRTKGENYAQAFLFTIWRNRPRYGGFIVHIGIILITIGVIGSSLCSDDFMVNLMWAGGGVLLLGGIIAFWPDQNQPKSVPELR